MPGTVLTAQAVADLVGGRLSGPGAVELTRVRSLALAGPDALAACAAARWSEAMASSQAGAVLVTEDLAAAPGPATRVIVPDPRRAIAQVAAVLHPDATAPAGIAPTAVVGRGAVLGAGVRVGHHAVLGEAVVIGPGSVIGPHVVIEDGAVLGREVRLDPHVTIHAGSVLGDRVHCQTGAVIGSPGFGFLSGAQGHERVPQVGGCVLGDDVEVGAGSCIDRGSLEDTVIGRGTKIDNLVHVGHNVRIGEHCLLMAGVGVSGSTWIGDRVVLAGQAGLVGHIEVGDGARIGAQAGVISSVPAGGAVSGYPARPHREFLRAQAALYRLAPHIGALEELLRSAEKAGRDG
ncbi:MAG: UDP-3-O-(3-hydroxymyristoyl)glucosamine N-acyltransferase [Gemmatimonadales bacterium]|nr:UDP-3-O-(3-hydroxymyristoyl)glucosamine N-acyltransferase [Gemmatimonadales bacterium]